MLAMSAASSPAVPCREELLVTLILQRYVSTSNQGQLQDRRGFQHPTRLE